MDKSKAISQESKVARGSTFPLLFVLCMDYFTRVLNKKSAQGFTFHKKCRELQLSHLCFVNDLMVFTNGDVDSIKIVKGVLDHLHDVSALKPNNKKKVLFVLMVLKHLLERKF